jgi:hypothetical protein
MSLPASYLSLADFKSRSIMPSEDVDVLVVLGTKRPADDTAADVSPERVLGGVLIDANLDATVFVPDAAAAANAVNFATLSMYKRTDGGAATLVAQLTTAATSLVAGVPVAVPVIAGAVLAGDRVSFAVTKSGAGVLFPSGRIYARPSVSFVHRRLAAQSSHIDARLRKRYAAPFAVPVPEIVLEWVERLVTRDCYVKRGFNPGDDAEDNEILARAVAAEAEVKEAADSKDGLFALPLRDDADADAIVKAGPLSYSEASPYVWSDVQAAQAAIDDESGRGS